MADLNFRISAQVDESNMSKVTRWLDDIQQKASNFHSIMSGGGSFGGTRPPVASTAGNPGPRPTSGRGPSYNLDTPAGLQAWTQNVFRPEATFIEQMLGSATGKPIGNPSPRPSTFMDAFKMSSGLGSATGSSSTQFGGALGGMARQYLPALTIAGAVGYAGSQVAQGYGMWQQSSQPIDQLSHSLGTAAQNVEQFRQQVVNAGSQFGWSMQQSTQSALTFAQTFGNIGQSNISNLVGSTASWGLQNGLTPSHATQITASSAALGVTSGVGSSMSATQFQNMLSNMASSGGMMGRQSAMNTGYLDVLNNVAASNPIVANPQALAGMYTSFSATGIQGMQGTRGANVLNQFNSSVMNASGYTQGITFAAMQKALGNKFNTTSLTSLLEAQQGGLSSYVPGTKTTLGSALMQYMQGSGMSQQNQVLALAPFFGGNLNEAQDALKAKNFGTSKPSTKSTQHPWYSPYDINQISKDTWDAGKAAAGYLVSPFADLVHGMGFGASTAATIGGSYLVGKYGGSILKNGLRATGKSFMADATKVGTYLRKSLGKTNWWEDAADVAKDADKVDGGGFMSYSQIQQGASAMQKKYEAAQLAKQAHKTTTTFRTTPSAHAATTSVHAATTTAHAEQVRQKAEQRTSSHLSTLKIDQLQISQISLLGSAASPGSSALANALNVGSAATAGGGNGSGGTASWWSDLTNDIKKLFGGGGASGSGKTGVSSVNNSAYSGGGSVTSWLQQAMKATNTPSKYLGDLETIAQNESSGDPNAINLWDSNAVAGNPSKGLMQVTGTTFAEYAAKGKNDIYNPVDNAIAAINYIDKTYGSIANVPGIKSLQSGGGYVGYAIGGQITHKQLAWLGEHGQEFVIPTDGSMRSRALDLYQRAGQALGLNGSSTPSVQASSGPGMVHLTPATLSTLIKGISNGVRQSASTPAIFSSASRGAVRP